MFSSVFEGRSALKREDSNANGSSSFENKSICRHHCDQMGADPDVVHRSKRNVEVLGSPNNPDEVLLTHFQNDQLRCLINCSISTR